MKKLSLLLTFAIGMIFLLGLLMIFSTTSAEVLDHALDKSTHLAPIRQISYAVFGIILSYATYRIGYQRLIDYSPQILLILTVMLVLVLIPGIGKEVNGSKRWLNILGISFQPSEFVKFFVPAFFIQRFLPLQDSSLAIRDFLKIVLLISIPMALIMIEPNNGTTAVVGAALLAVFFLMRVPFRFWALPLGLSLFIGVLFASQLPYVTARINVYLHPELDLKGKGHQPHQAKIAAGSGQFWGRGPGNSLQKMSYLPEAQNDYIAAIYAEEWGFLGILCLIALYMTAVFAGFSIAFKAKTRSGLYMGGVIAFLLGLQAFLNMGVVSGLLPSTGLNLPFFSQGGSSLMANMAGIGILLSIRE